MSKQPTSKLIWQHIEAIGTCMMVTHDGDDVRARPMRGISRPEQNAIWFFADRESRSDEEMRQNPVVCLTYTSQNNEVYLSVSGRMSRVVGKATIAELWNEDAGAYFPNGPDDPRVVLLRFEPEIAEYWTAPSSPIVIAIKFLEARLLGERPSLGTNGRTRLP